MFEQLFKYQDTDAKLRKIEVELSGSEERKKAVSAKKYLEGVEESIAKLDARASELAIAFESAGTELAKLKEQQSEFVHAMENMEESEASYLMKKTDEVLAKIKALTTEIARVSAETEKLMKEYSTIKATTKAAQAQYSEYGKKYNELKASKKEEMLAIEKELEVIKDGIEPALMDKYLKKRADKIFPIVFELNGNTCGACNMELSMLEISKLNNGAIIECEQCKMLLCKK